MSARCLLSRLVVAVMVSMACLCAPALAGVTRPLLFSFGSFSNVQGVAVDQSGGDVYVLDTGAGGGSLFKFDASGKPLKFTGLPGEPLSITGLHGGGGFENEIAVDSSTGPAKGDVYVAVSSSNGEKIDVIAPNGESLGVLSESTAPWGDTCGVATDPSGNVYVGVYGGYVDRFTPTTNPVANSDYSSSIVKVNHPCNLAADSEGNVFEARYGGGPVERYESWLFGMPGSFGSIVDRSGSSLAVDQADDHVFVDAEGEVAEFGAHGEPFQAPLSKFAQGKVAPFGIAVNDASEYVYVSGSTGAIDAYGPQTTVPDANVQPASDITAESATLNGTVNPEGIAVVSCQFEYGTSPGVLSSTVPCSSNPGSGNSPVSVSAPITGLAPTTVYYYRLSAANAGGSTDSEESSLRTQGPAEVLSESFSNIGSASATVTAEIAPNGLPTTYRVEYGPTPSYGSATIISNVGAGNQTVGVVAVLDGLQPDSEYHFRFTATNTMGTAHGADITFSTFPTSPLGLPDNRGYEMVTPPNNEDAQLYRPGGTFGGSENAIFTELPVRAAANGDAITYAADPNAEGNGSEGSGYGNQYMAIRESGGGWKQSTIQPKGRLSPFYAWFSEDVSTAVLSSNEPLVAGVPSDYTYLYKRDNSTGSISPLFTVKPPNRTPASFGVASFYGTVNVPNFAEFYAGASSDNKRQFFEANDALTPNAVDGGEAENNLYESAEGSLRLVNVLPDGKSEPNASFGAPPAEQEEVENASHAISTDGSRAFWTDMNTGALYVRENGTSTALVAENATFLTASADGSRVLYVKNGDLYQDELPGNVSTDLAPGGEVLGLAGAGENAQYVYFVAEGSLAAGATTGKPNLYLYHAGTTTLIAKLASEAEERSYTHFDTGEFNDWRPGLGHRTAMATPDGHALVFESVESLTGYDNHGQNGYPANEVYVYDATSGSLACTSCSPSGEPPIAGSETSIGYIAVSERRPYQQRSISSDGDLVFFQTAQPLVAQDINGTTDVYEWERDGSGSCALSSGCIYLLSNGSSHGASFFVDASEDGSNVFFGTEAQLVPEDRNEVYDLYDARVDARQPTPTLQCSGAGCQGVPEAPPIFATPSSVTFNGVGNFDASAKPAGQTKPKVKKTKRKASKKHVRHKHHGKAKKKPAAKQGTAGKSGRGVR
jgi:hypothetical protein